MSTIKVDTIATRTGSGNITLSNNVASLTSAGAISGTNLTASGTLGVTGITTLSNRMNINFNGSATQAMHLKDTGGGNLASFGLYYNPSNTLIGNIQNANNTGIHLNVGTNGSVVFDQTGYTAANALDDYEEGTWTPDLRNADNANSFTTEEGYYTKVGNRVFAQFRCDYGNTGGGGGIQIRNLPFAYNGNFSCVGIVAVNGGSMSGNNKQYAVFATSGTTFQIYNGGSISSETYTFLSGSIHYLTNS